MEVKDPDTSSEEYMIHNLFDEKEIEETAKNAQNRHKLKKTEHRHSLESISHDGSLYSMRTLPGHPEHLWNQKLEQALNDIAINSKLYFLAHDEMSSKYSMKSFFLTNIVTLMGILVTTGIFGSLSFCNETIWAQVITGIINTLNIFLSRYQVASGYLTLAQDHKFVSARWSKLFHEIDIQMKYDPIDRQNAKEFTRRIINIYNDLLESSPNISKKILKKYKISGENISTKYTP